MFTRLFAVVPTIWEMCRIFVFGFVLVFFLFSASNISPQLHLDVLPTTKTQTYYKGTSTHPPTNQQYLDSIHGPTITSRRTQIFARHQGVSLITNLIKVRRSDCFYTQFQILGVISSILPCQKRRRIRKAKHCLRFIDEDRKKNLQEINVLHVNHN